MASGELRTLFLEAAVARAAAVIGCFAMIVAASVLLRILRNFTHDARAQRAAWSMLEYVAYPAMMFLATPSLIAALGAEQYGQWMLLLTFNGFGSVAGLGMAAATIKEVAEFRGRGDLPGAAKSVRNTLGMTIMSSLVLAAIIIIVGVTFGPHWLAKVGKPDVIIAITVAAALSIILEQIDVVFVGAMKGVERFDLSTQAEAISKAVIVGALLAVARMTGSLYWVVGTSLALTIARTLVKAVIAGRLTGVRMLFPQWHQKSVRRIFAFGKWTWLLAITATLFGTVDRLLIGGLLGAESLARYSVCLQLAQQVHAIPAAAAVIFFPMVSRMIAEGHDVRNVATKGMALLCALAVGIGAPLVIFRAEILRLWVGPSLASGAAPVLAALVVAFAILAVNAVPHFVMLGLGRPRPVALVNIVAGVCSVATAYAAIKLFGLVGAAFGRAAFAIVSSAIAFEMFRRLRPPSLPLRQIEGSV